MLNEYTKEVMLSRFCITLGHQIFIHYCWFRLNAKSCDVYITSALISALQAPPQTWDNWDQNWLPTKKLDLLHWCCSAAWGLENIPVVLFSLLLQSRDSIISLLNYVKRKCSSFYCELKMCIQWDFWEWQKNSFWIKGEHPVTLLILKMNF